MVIMKKNSGITDLGKWEEDGWDVSLWNLQSLADDIKLLLKKNYDYIFFDYPFGYMQKQISEFISLSVYLDTPLDVSLARRTLRDSKNKSAAEILGELEWYLNKRHLFTMSRDFQIVAVTTLAFDSKRSFSYCVCFGDMLLQC